MKRGIAAASLVALVVSAGPASGAKLTPASTEEIRKLLDVVASMHEEIGGTRFGELAEGQSIDLPFPADATIEYYVNALCDDDCANLDLVAMEADGTEIDIDDADDNGPVLNIQAATYRSPLDKPKGDPRPITLRVSMKSCGAETCGYGLRVAQVVDWK